MFLRVLAVVSGNHIDYIVAGECDGSVKACQAHQDTLWGDIEEHTRTVVYKVISNVRGPTVVDISGSTVASVVIDVRKGEFTVWAQVFGRYPYLQAFKSTVAFLLCIHVGVSELLAHDECGGIPFP